MKTINTPKEAQTLVGKKKKTAFSLNDSQYRIIYSALKSKYEECGVLNGIDFPGTKEDSDLLNYFFTKMGCKESITVKDIEKLKGIFKKIGWGFPILRDEEDTSRAYRITHFWAQNDAKLLANLWDFTNDTQIQMDGRDSAELRKISIDWNNKQYLTDNQLQIIIRLYEKYIKRK